VVCVSRTVSEPTLRNAIVANDGNALGSDWPNGVPGEAGREGSEKADATVAGKVTYQGQPLPGGTVTFHGKGGSTPGVKIGEEGSYRLTRLRPGSYRVTVSMGSPPDEPRAGPRKDSGLTPPPRGRFPRLPAKYASPATT